MSTEWYCKIGDRQLGPLSTQQLKQLAADGQLTGSSLLRRGENGQWVKASQVKGLDVAASKTVADSKTLKRATPLADSSPPTPPRTASTQTATPVYSAADAAKAAPAQRPTPVYQQSALNPTPFVDTERVESLNEGLNAAMKWAIGIGVVCAIGLIVLIVVMNTQNDDPDLPPVANVNDSDPEATPPDPEADPPVKQTQSPQNSTQPAGPHPALASISRWRSTNTGARLLNRTAGQEVVFWVDEVWLGNGAAAIADAPKPAVKGSPDLVFDAKALGLDPNKQRTSPTGRILDSAGAKTPDSPGPKKQSAEAPRYLLVRVKINNKSAEQALDYTSFNGGTASSKDLQPMLFDDQGQQLQFVGKDQVDSPQRLQEAEIAPGETAFDVLVFELPPETFQHLQLLLPRAAVGMQIPGRDFVGYRISKDDLSGGGITTPPPPTKPPADRPKDDVAKKAPEQPAPSKLPAPPAKGANSGKQAFDALQRELNKDK